MLSLTGVYQLLSSIVDVIFVPEEKMGDDTLFLYKKKLKKKKKRTKGQKKKGNSTVCFRIVSAFWSGLPIMCCYKLSCCCCCHYDYY